MSRFTHDDAVWIVDTHVLVQENDQSRVGWLGRFRQHPGIDALLDERMYARVGKLRGSVRHKRASDERPAAGPKARAILGEDIHILATDQVAQELREMAGAYQLVRISQPAAAPKAGIHKGTDNHRPAVVSKVWVSGSLIDSAARFHQLC